MIASNPHNGLPADGELTTNTDPVLALAEYFLSANYFHELVLETRDQFFEMAPNAPHHYSAWIEFRTIYSHWLSSLYVVVEGFKELNLADDIVLSLAEQHIDELRLFRNATFHFQRQHEKHAQFHNGLGDRMNWAEELHEELADFFRMYLSDLGYSIDA